MSLIEYQRSGGRAPANDERLVIEGDGRFVLRRTVGSSRVGSFAGELPAAKLKTLKKQVAEASGEVPEKTTGLGPRVLERVTTEETAVSFALEQKLPPKLRALARSLRGLCDSLVEHPVSAVELRLSDDASMVTLSAAGAKTVPANFSDASLSYSLFGEQEEFLTSGAAQLPDELRATDRVEPGWSVEVPIPSGLEFNPKRTLQVLFTFRLQGDDKIRRECQLSGVAGKGW